MSDDLDGLRRRLDGLAAIVERLGRRQVEVEDILTQAVGLLGELAHQRAVDVALEERRAGGMLH